MDTISDHPEHIEGISFRKLARGGAFFSFGTICAMGLQFVVGIVVIRAIKRPEFGLISLTNIFVNMVVMLAVLGFGNGLPRLMAMYRQKNEENSVRIIIGTAMVIVLISGLLWSLILLLVSPWLAECFKKPGIQNVLMAFVLMVPPLAFIRTLTAIFRGAESTYPKVIFEDISLNLCRILLLLPVLFLGMGFQGVIWIYVGSVWISFAAYILYAKNKPVFKKLFFFSRPMANNLLLFSLPLLGIAIMGNLVTWTGTLTVGYLQSADQVALYSAPLRLASLMSLPLTALIFLYLPMATKLFEEASLKKLKVLYANTTKLAFFVTMPILLFFFIDADFIVVHLFGRPYQDSANILRVLLVGFSVHIFLGPNSVTLISMGDTRTLFHITMISCLSAIVLCVTLVPIYGGIGAAAGISLSRIISNLIVSTVLYKQFNIHPFNWSYIKPTAFSFILSLLFYWLFSPTNHFNVILHSIMLLFIISTVLMSPIITHSLNSSDIAFIGSIEQRIWNRAILAKYLSYGLK